MKLVIIGLCAALSGCAMESQQPQLGSDAYIQGQIMGAQVQEAIASAHLARIEADQAESVSATRAALAKAWRSAGFSDDEATAMANAYQYQPAEHAIIERAKRDGSKVTREAIKAAYANYNYLLADQLFIGFAAALNAEHQAASATE